MTETRIKYRYGLKDSDIQVIQTVFSHFPNIAQVVLYGSRAKGNYRIGSDIDLTLKTNDQTESNLLFKVIGELDDLNLAYSFDISIFDKIENANLVEHITRKGLEFYNAEQFLLNKKQKEKRLDFKESKRQSEAQLEESLVDRLTGLGYDRVNIKNADELRLNLKKQLETHNKIQLSNFEFAKVLNHLDKGNVFERAKILRDRFQFTRDDGSSRYLQFLNTDHWCQNQYQVTNQISIEGKYKTRYDVTLLVNGFPLVQIELKRRGMELKEAFNQINRYQRHSFWAENGLFQYVQIFIISNGVNTRYYANNRKQEFKQTFYWADEENNPITQLNDFADQFLEKCHVSKMICKYIVLHESDKLLMVLRPYQFYAVEAIVERVKSANGHLDPNGKTKNGYIWHATGSGKTLTSFKASQILTALPKVHKVVFVVDRADLDYQTSREFNFFSDGSVDGTSNTKALVKQMADDTALIITTIQKLNSAIKKPKHNDLMTNLKDKRIVFIFDECHRSQFGETHKNIVKFFNNSQLFGFTGTPILKDNATKNEHGKRTTIDLFDKCLHKYLITHAIADDNVLKFSIEYWGKLKRKDGSLIDEKVASINTKEFFEAPKRINDIVDWVILHHKQKTHNKHFSAIMCVNSVPTLIEYYKAFKDKKNAGEHDLRVVTIFTYNTNEDDDDANGEIGDPDFDINADDTENKHSREELEECVVDYNALYQTKHSVKDSKAFYTYYKDIAKRMKDRDKEKFKDKDRADILLVVNMYLTGFDAKKLNTLYVDKNLKYHGLIQAFSRTNRILGELKSQGNIICFRNLKENTDKAITLFSNKDALEKVLIEPYDDYVDRFNQGVVELQSIVTSPNDVNQLISEDDQVRFVRAFRQLMQILNVLKSFIEFTWVDLKLTEQEFDDFKSKYLDIYERTRSHEEVGSSIIDEVDFQLELIHQDEINVAYIIKLLADLHYKKQDNTPSEEFDKIKNSILDLLGKETQLRSKRELIEQFINEHMPNFETEADIENEFTNFWSQQKEAALSTLCESEKMDIKAVHTMIDAYHFSGKELLRDTVFTALLNKPKLLERKKIFERFASKFKDFINTFDDDIGNI